jgi:SAM-dependent methyltransferase
MRTIINFFKKTRRYLLTPFVVRDLITYKSKEGSKRFSTKIRDIYPCVRDKTVTTGFDRHYVYHTSWAARVVREINPKYHVDISSSLYFSGILSAFIPVHFYDYRPAKLILSDLESKHGDLHHLPFENNSIESISCMHTIEHIGLGRYGDPIDANGDMKAIKELKRVVAKNGNLLIVVPVGKPKIEFNAHRIYSYEQIISYIIDDDFSLKEFSFIPEFESEGGLERNANPDKVKNAKYACGCFWFVKKS